MKKVLLTIAFALIALCSSANSIRYFTASQARRTVDFLNSKNELIIFCGYEYELETYVILNDVWSERAEGNHYEVWIFGYDAYTGEEIYMPIDLACIWLYNSSRNHIYSAARFLRFQCSQARPNIEWCMPHYNSFVRIHHSPTYVRTYHYDIHLHGWMPPLHPDPIHPIHPYYMRPPTAPLPVIVHPYTPGREKPQVQINDNRNAQRPAPTSVRSQSTPFPTSNTNTNATKSGRSNSTATPSTSRSSSTATPASSTRNSSTSTRSSSSATPTSSSRSNSSATPSTSSRSNSTATPTSTQKATQTSRSSSSATPSATATKSSSSSRSVSTPSTTTSRSSSTSATPKQTTSSSSVRSSSSSAQPSTSRSSSSPAPQKSTSRTKSSAN